MYIFLSTLFYFEKFNRTIYSNLFVQVLVSNSIRGNRHLTPVATIRSSFATGYRHGDFLENHFLPRESNHGVELARKRDNLLDYCSRRIRNAFLSSVIVNPLRSYIESDSTSRFISTGSTSNLARYKNYNYLYKFNNYYNN